MDRFYEYKEVVGASAESFDQAIREAVARASAPGHELRWFEVQELRGRMQGGQVVEFQARLKIAYRSA